MKRTTKKMEAAKSNRNTYIILSLSCTVTVLARSFEHVSIEITRIEKPIQEDVKMNFDDMAGRPIQEDFTMDFDDENYVIYGQRKRKVQDMQEIQEEGERRGRKVQEEIGRREMEEKVDILSVI